MWESGLTSSHCVVDEVANVSHKPVCGSLTSLVHTVLLMSGRAHGG